MLNCEADKPLVATIPEKGTGLISEIKKREDVRLFELTPHNQEQKLKELTMVIPISCWNNIRTAFLMPFKSKYRPDRLEKAWPKSLKASKIGLLVHPASINSRYIHAAELFFRSKKCSSAHYSGLSME